MPHIDQIVYFDNTSQAEENTAAVVKAVDARLQAGDARHVVVASNTGYVGAQFAPLARSHPQVRFAAVKMAPAVDRIYQVEWNQDYGRQMEEAGVELVCGTHALTGGVDRALRAKFQGIVPNAVIAETLYLFSQGMKVCVEIVAMACDADALPEGVPVISCAGTGHGADTAILATSAASANLFDLTIHRILAMPLGK